MQKFNLDVNSIDWQKVDGLLPAIIQDSDSRAVLMQGYMNAEALAHSLDTGKVTFFSRTKGRLWTKGETSNHFLNIVDCYLDCDHDSLLIMAKPDGVTCHTGAYSCFGEYPNMAHRLAFLGELENVIAERKNDSTGTSYTHSLYQSGIKRIAQKVGEEGVETALAAVAGDKEELLNESADLLYHLTVLLQANDLSLDDVMNVLQARHSKAKKSL
ncbi:MULTISPECIES: bifunctional phosphoribosyl-AMP cyclohydrolase/phosphoribosyl-ATP diphosphatase HisIE [unclassified Acinetobacter]|uniref:bifunctional phosphoribosyl-AMP cyclohydrolase/phosphoribosyl-ATP diphosphatase HisIE n=1 Tax=unclassified Acinetobacter TaxID=196816 RepID=UPI0035BA8506